MGRKRSRIEIIYDILDALSEEPTTPTRLATLANMPYDRLQPMLEELESKGLVSLEHDRGNPRARVVVITAKGRLLLDELRRVRKVLRDFGLPIL